MKTKTIRTFVRSGSATLDEHKAGGKLGASLYLQLNPVCEHPMNEHQRAYFKAVKNTTVGDLFEKYETEEIPEWLDDIDFGYSLGKHVGKVTEAHMQRKFFGAFSNSMAAVKIIGGTALIVASLDYEDLKKKRAFDKTLEENPGGVCILPEDLKRAVRVNDRANCMFHGLLNVAEGLAWLYLGSGCKDTGWK